MEGISYFPYTVALLSLIHILRDMPYNEGTGKVYMGMGIYLLPEKPADYFTAQYNADICRSECPETAYRNSHMEVYGMTYQDKNLTSYDFEQMLQPAMENEEFKLYLQPKVDLKTGEVHEAEALVRWINPERGMIPVGEFLPELVRNGLISDLDLYLFEKVCRYINKWIDLYGKKIRISVNPVSYTHLDVYKRQLSDRARSLRILS